MDKQLIITTVPAIRQMLSRSGRALKSLKLTPCDSADAELTLQYPDAEAIERFVKAHGRTPKSIFVPGAGLLQVTPSATQGRVAGRTVIVTGAAQGFGEGIARGLMAEGANIVVADLNETTGTATAAELNKISSGGRAIFVKVDVSDPASAEAMVERTVMEFGAVDVLVNNAGVLRAGALDSLTAEQFDFVTKVNYYGYYYCARAVAPVMKAQTAADPEYFADIVQVNSKSGLRGSKANFAYAGGKFGGIGLTQSFALELAPCRIKVNSICPGNFYDGPLWSEPQKGLFVQYLQAGKVPGARTTQDVKDYYLSQVPMRKGCTPADVTKAILYAIEQTGETGQAIPVTGGQVMLG